MTIFIAIPVFKKCLRILGKLKIILQRIYDDSSADGYRVLVDRLWPRGVSKERANLDDWWKDLAPSDTLRKWFNHDEAKWKEFRRKYLHELSELRGSAQQHLDTVSSKPLVLLYATKNGALCHAHVLKEYFEKLG